MGIHVQLGNRSYCFLSPSVDGWKNLNYVFGKNGTGKSSLAKELELQNKSEYQTYLYDGSDGVIKDANGDDKDGLGFILLGKENVSVDGKIAELQELRSAEQGEFDRSRDRLNSQEEVINAKKEACETALWNSVLNQYHEFDSDLDDLRLENKRKLWNRKSKTLFFESMSSLLNSEEYTVNSKTIEELRNIKETFSNGKTIDLYQELLSWDDFDLLRSSLQETIGSSTMDAFAHNVKDHHLEGWFERGWQVLDDNPERTCPFCNQTIDEHSLTSLRNTYDQVIDAAYQTMKKLWRTSRIVWGGIRTL